MGLSCDQGVTKGKCIHCQVVWYWKTGKHRLKDTKCKSCGAWLIPTTHLMKRFVWKPYDQGTANGVIAQRVIVTGDLPDILSYSSTGIPQP